jgi:hypothetical protein
MHMLISEVGDYTGGLMDASYAVKKLITWQEEKQRRARTSAALRTQQVLACVLNAYEGWLDRADFRADDFPVKAQVIARFNPVHKEQAAEREKAAIAHKRKLKEERAARLAAARRAKREERAGVPGMMAAV